MTAINWCQRISYYLDEAKHSELHTLRLANIRQVGTEDPGWENYNAYAVYRLWVLRLARPTDKAIPELKSLCNRIERALEVTESV